LRRGTPTAHGTQRNPVAKPKELTMNATSHTASVEVNATPILSAATTREASSVLGALAISGMWILVLAAVLFGVLAPLNNAFACTSAAQGELTAFNTTHANCQMKKV